MYVFRDTKWHDQSDMRDVSLAKRERERERTTFLWGDATPEFASKEEMFKGWTQ